MKFELIKGIKMWTNKKFKKRKFIGKYVKAENETRVFQLTSENLKPKTYDSWQAAKRDGWSKI